MIYEEMPEMEGGKWEFVRSLSTKPVQELYRLRTITSML